VPKLDTKLSLTLAETQRLLKAIITDPRGAAAALRDMPGAAHLIRPNNRMTAAQRAEVYNEAYFARIIQALQEDFASLDHCCGSDRFAQLLRDYLVAHPSTHFSLRYAGRHLAGYLSDHPILEEWPFLSELARFEWELLEAFDAPDSVLLTEEDLTHRPPETWGTLPLRFIQSTQLCHFQWPVDTMRDCLREQTDLPVMDAEPCSFLIWRPQHDVKYRRLEREELYLLETVVFAKSDFGTLCNVVAHHTSDAEAAAVSGRFLKHWLSDGVLQSVSLRGAPA
jgi:hypothetical protein